MADIQEWIKGITFFLFASFLFYFFWDNIFSNIITYVGTDLFNIGSEGTASIAILKTVGWVSFTFLWLTTVPIYAFYTILSGSRNDVKTQPLELLKGIGIWTIMMPFLSFIYALIHFLVTSLNNSQIIDSTLQDTATNLSWVMGTILLLILTFIPFYYILKGYGIIGKKGGTS